MDKHFRRSFANKKSAVSLEMYWLVPPGVRYLTSALRGDMTKIQVSWGTLAGTRRFAMVSCSEGDLLGSDGPISHISCKAGIVGPQPCHHLSPLVYPVKYFLMVTPLQ